jgi:hypothetical protein
LNSVIDFAKTTPFQIEDVTKAFIRLKSAASLEPDIKMLKTFGDAASIPSRSHAREKPTRLFTHLP